MMKFPGGTVIAYCIDSQGNDVPFSTNEGPYNGPLEMLSHAAAALAKVEHAVKTGLIQAPARVVLDFS